MHKGEILMYQTPDGNTQLDVKLDDENVWINRQQMAELFDRDVKTIGKHINNALKEELNGLSTVANFATVQTEGNRKIERNIDYYNLDMIISVGYRVKSNRGIQFRIWANQILKKYLVKGYSLNESRLQEQNDQLTSLKNTVNLLSNVLENKSLNTDEATGLLRVVTDYAYALDILDKYDHQLLTIEGTTAQELFAINYDEAKQAIHDLKEKFGGSSLFGNEKDQSFKSSIATIYQTFDGIDLYPSVEEKAASLLYFVVKNHSFSDGNKRIAAYLFVWFLDKNNILYKPDGSKRIADNALVALTLMIAESKSDEKEMMVKVIVNLINIKN
ncbi:RhuM family protein [Pedobacter gandavensis]|uniref:RhuM family protein n=1 Tax=Pedobacter gandavensis TaxID=2679963 RepID=UPI002931B142|nr:RhuM family protein [Pedobacter gandavensis]